MFASRSLDDLSEVEVLGWAEVCAETARRAEVELLRVAYQWAVLHDPDRLDPVEAALPGRQKSRYLAGDGTAAVTEFAAAELGARIGRTTYYAVQLIADAQDLRHRHPQLWSRVEAGEVRASYARHVTARTRELSMVEAMHVDAEVAESADGRIPWTRFEELVEGKIASAAPAVARAKEERARRARFARKLHGQAHGMASFMIRADVASIELIDAGVTDLAKRLARAQPTGSEDTDDDRRVQTAVTLLSRSLPEDPAADGATTGLEVSATLVVHLAGDGERDLDEEGRLVPRVARLEGHGPVTEDWIRTVLGPKARFVVRPVLDPLGQAPVDAYEIPALHRRAVQVLSPADCFPWGSALATEAHPLEIDHTVAYDEHGPPGQSRIGNYGPLTRTHHRIKTHTGWQVRQPFPGIYLWRDPHGGHYLVDHTGTRRVRPVDGDTGHRAHLYYTQHHVTVEDYAAA